MSKAWCGAFVLFAAMASQDVARGQVADTVAAKPVYISGRDFKIDGYPMYIIGKPFSLVEKTTTIREQSDGTSRTSESIKRFFRDSEGRFRMEGGVMKNGTFLVWATTIFDPVALTEIRFETHATTGTLRHVSPRTTPTLEEEPNAAEQLARSEAYRRKHPDDWRREELGTLALAGEIATGARVMTKAFSITPGHPAIRRVTETWTCSELGIPLLTKDEGIFPGIKTIKEVTELKRGEPDAELFKVPKGLELKEEVRPR
jgi:hypothetical protein